MMKKLLLLTYYFPPCGGAGVQRWLRLLPYMQENGWDVTVLTTRDGDYPVLDSSLCRKIPENIRVVRTRTPSLSKLYHTLTGNKNGLPHGSLQTSQEESFLAKLSCWYRLNFIVPDSRRVWNGYAYKKAVELLRSIKYDLIITTGPPHSTHLTGKRLADNFPVKWVADFRDPWTKITYLQTAPQNFIIRHLNKSLESKIIAAADLNLVVSKTIAESLPDGRKIVLYNGFDPKDFPQKTAKATQNSNLLKVKYVGAVRTGHPMQTAIRRLEEAVQEKLAENIELSLIGSFPDEKAPGSDLITIRNAAHLDHAAALKEMADSDILLLLIRKCPDNKGILTTKLFEYLASGSYIAGIGPVDGEAAQLLKDTEAGTMVDYDDKKSFLKIISDVSRPDSSINDSSQRERVNCFAAPNQAKYLAQILNRLLQ